MLLLFKMVAAVKELVWMSALPGLVFYVLIAVESLENCQRVSSLRQIWAWPLFPGASLVGIDSATCSNLVNNKLNAACLK